jgi:2',3'-cyclic-nucleotide 2'-phosphodiesterase (5'-nucleotidase family)
MADYEGFDYDLLVLLSHLGLEGDKNIASRLPSIDVIVGGHSHTVLDKPINENGVMIVQAGEFGEYLGELVIDIDDEKGVRHFEGRLISGEKYAPMPAIVELIKHYSKEADRALSKELYVVPVDLSHSLTCENSLGNLLADALKDVVEAEVGIINSGVLTGGVGKGWITTKKLHHLCPSPLNPTYMDVRGCDLKLALEKSLSKELQLSDGGGPGSRTTYLGNLQVSDNVQVRIEGSSITSITVDDRPLDGDRWYSVGTSDFLQRGTGYPWLASNKNVRYRPEFLRDILRIYLRKKTFLKRAAHKRFVDEQVSSPVCSAS